MRGTDFEYNQYLRYIQLRAREGKEKSEETKQAQCLRHINSVIQREYYTRGDKKDYFKRATYSCDGKTFVIHRNGDITSNTVAKRFNGGCVTNVRGWCYRKLTLPYIDSEGNIDSCFVEVHVLVMLAAFENFLDTYMSDITFIVNHTMLLSNETVRTNDYDAVYNLELINRSENAKHGNFCRKYGLLDTHIEYNDISKIKGNMKIAERYTGQKRLKVEKYNQTLAKAFYILNGQQEGVV